MKTNAAMIGLLTALLPLGSMPAMAEPDSACAQTILQDLQAWSASTPTVEEMTERTIAWNTECGWNYLDPPVETEGVRPDLRSVIDKMFADPLPGIQKGGTVIGAGGILAAAEDNCPGAGSALLSWTWHIILSTGFLTVDVPLFDLGVNGWWDESKGFLGETTVVGQAAGKLGEVLKKGETAKEPVLAYIRVLSLWLPATGSITPRCQPVPLLPDLPLAATYNFANSLSIPGAATLTLQGFGTVCLVPC